MAARLIAFLLMLGVTPGARAWQTPSAPNGPTMAETTAWIEAHLVGIAHGSRKNVVTIRMKKGKSQKESDRQTTNSHESVVSAKFDGCSLTIGQLYKGDDYSVLTTSVVPLDRLTLASSKIEKYEASKVETAEQTTTTDISPASAVVLTLEGSTKVISYRRKSTGSVAPEWNTIPFEGSIATLTIHSDDEEMPPRLANAFNHAILLCRKDAKPEPF